MNRAKRAFAALAACLVLGFSNTSLAITAGELLADDDSKYISRYLMGLVDMFAYLQFTEGDDDRGNCIYNWYYRTEGSVEAIYGYLEKFPDKAPEAIVWVLAKRACPLQE